DLPCCHDGARSNLSWRQVPRVLPQVPGTSHPRCEFQLLRRLSAPSGAVHLFLLRTDRPPRAPHDHRARSADGDDGLRVARTIFIRALRADRGGWAVLALRGHRLDFPVPAAVSSGSASMTARTLSLKSYLIVFGMLVVLTVVTTGVAYVDLGFFN